MPTQHDINLTFINQKGFDTSSITSHTKALHWLKTTDVDNLMYGEPSGDEFDRAVDEMRRPMLIESVEREIKRLESTKS